MSIVDGQVVLPEVRLEAAFSSSSSTGNLLTLNDPTRGKLDTGILGGSIGGDEVPVWTDLTPWLRSANVERGSRRVDQPVVTYEPGTLSAVLDNSDRRFDPSWTEGPYTEDSTELDGTSTTLNGNTGFESGTTGWAGFGGTLTTDGAAFHSGAASGKFTPTGSASQPFVASNWQSFTEGQTYQATAWVRATATSAVFVAIHWYTAGAAFISQSAETVVCPAGTWTQVSVTGVAPAGATQGPMLVTISGTPPASNVLRVDDATLAHLPYRRTTQVTAMRAVRLTATWDGTTYELWRGFADQWEITWTGGSDYSECQLTATDASKVLAGVDRTALVAPVGGGEDSGARVNRILDSAAWPTLDRVVATGDSVLADTTLDGDAWAELQLVALSELGELFVDGGGRVVFRNRRAYLSDPRSNTSQATFGDTDDVLPAEDVAIASDDATFFNDVRVTISEGVEQVAEDAASIAQHYRKTYRPAEPLLPTDADALDYANWLLHIASEPELRFTNLVLLPAAGPAELWEQALGREIGDRITVQRQPPGGGDPIVKDAFVRGITHEFTDESWRTSFTLQDATRYGSFFVLDHATLGRLDSGNALAY